jgi:hydroxyethylthiazole kinase-like uncharacterized protein yjeF
MSALPYQMFATSEVKAIEKAHAAAAGGNCYDLMQQAGKALASAVRSRRPGARLVWVFAGRGNNGGDGYAAASELMGEGLGVRLFACGAPHEGSEASAACENFISCGGIVETLLPGRDDPRPDAIIDALLGTGVREAPRSPIDEWIMLINSSRSFVVSADVPSGLNADTGCAPGECVRADCTVCMLALKPGLFTGEAVDYCGEVVCDPLGVDVRPFSDRKLTGGTPILRQAYADIVPDLPQRLRSCNKGDNGKVLLIAGSRGMGGAAAIAGTGALRAGAGLVKVACDPACALMVNCVHPELMTVDFNSDSAVEAALKWCGTVAVGPGLSTSPRARELVRMAVESGRDSVFDADALNILASEPPEQVSNRIITPHPGEASRLLGCTVEEVESDRLAAARELQSRYGGVALLKGAGTVICDGRRTTVISGGSPALASGGMGDLLTGIIAALSAGGLTQSQAAVFGACIHARAGEIAEEKYGAAGTLPTDLEESVRRLANGRADV